MNSKRKNILRITSLYNALQALYWSVYCVLCSYVAVYLIAFGFSNFLVGVILAAGNILSMFLQPIMGSVSDKYPRFTVMRLLIIIGAVSIVLLLCAYLLSSVKTILSIAFALAIALMFLMNPLVNSVSIYYLTRGIDVNFGLARGFGSLGYAVASPIIGLLLARFSEGILPLLGIVFYVLIILVLILFPKEAGKPMENQESNAKKQSIWECFSPRFLKRYSGFTLVLMGIVCLYIAYASENNYLIKIVERAGGSSVEMGYIMALCAVLELPVMAVFYKIVRKFSVSGLLAFSAIGLTAKSLMFVLSYTVPMLLGLQILQMFGFALFIPATVYYSNKIMAKEDQFKGQSFMTMAMALGAVLGSLFGGLILDAMGLSAMLIIFTAISMLGTLLIFISGKKAPVK